MVIVQLITTVVIPGPVSAPGSQSVVISINENQICGTVTSEEYHNSCLDSLNYITAALVLRCYRILSCNIASMSTFIWNEEVCCLEALLSPTHTACQFLKEKKNIIHTPAFHFRGAGIIFFDSLAFLTDPLILLGCEQLLWSDMQRIESSLVL